MSIRMIVLNARGDANTQREKRKLSYIKHSLKHFLCYILQKTPLCKKYVFLYYSAWVKRFYDKNFVDRPGSVHGINRRREALYQTVWPGRHRDLFFCSSANLLLDFMMGEAREPPTWSRLIPEKVRITFSILYRTVYACFDEVYELDWQVSRTTIFASTNSQ